MTNPSSNPAVAFFLRADVRRGTAAGTALPGDNEVLPVTWSDNDVTLWPGESQTLTATYAVSRPQRRDAGGQRLRLEHAERGVRRAAIRPGPGGRQPRAAHQGHQLLRDRKRHSAAHRDCARAGSGAPGRVAAARFTTSKATVAGGPARRTAGPQWSVTSVANSPDTTPSTSFTQGDSADTYTLTVTNTGHAATDGTTPVTLTDVVDPNISMVSISGSGWTCDTSNDPTEVCTETGGSGGGPAVLQPGQSYPPVTLTVSVPQTAGYGTQDSTAGLHVTNAVTVTGGRQLRPVHLDRQRDAHRRPAGPDRRQRRRRRVPPGRRRRPVPDHRDQPGRRADQRQPVDARHRHDHGPADRRHRAGAVRQRLDLQHWPRSPARSPSRPTPATAATCWPGENGEEPPITVVVSVANNAAASGNETVQVSGGGDAASPANVSAATTIAPGRRPERGQQPLGQLRPG